MSERFQKFQDILLS